MVFRGQTYPTGTAATPGGGGAAAQPGCNGAANTGGGGGGSSDNNDGGDGGSGVVILRIATACKPASFAVSPPTNSTGTTGSCTVATFTVSGTLTL